MKQISVACQGAGVIPIKQLVPFQGNLKTLSDINYEKLKNEILERGFSFPFQVWRNDNQAFLIDGHQRLRTLTKMAEEGYSVPDLPVDYVEAKNIEEAKHKVLTSASQYGYINDGGLHDFVIDANMDPAGLLECISLPGIGLEHLDQIFTDIKLGVEFNENAEEKLKTEIEGEVANVQDFLVLTFETREEFEGALNRIGLKIGRRKLSYAEFMERVSK